MTMLTETRERFLLAIAAQVPAERVAEIHFFQPIRQGGVESGVAVVVERGAAPAETPDDVPSVEMEESPYADDIDVPRPEPDEPRIVVHTARYRHILKGIDRGKWEASVVAQADAPLVAVDAVVRGVQRRSGDLDDATRMEGDEVRAFMDARRPAVRVPAPT